MWDVYANDYVKLSETKSKKEEKEEESTSMTQNYVEHRNYYLGNLCRGRVINDLSWHPEWTGIMVAAYTPTAKSENLNGRKPPDKVRISFSLFD